MNNEHQLSDKQVEHWREVLCGILGPYALIMSKEDIQRLRDKMQEHAYKLDEKLQESAALNQAALKGLACSCDPKMYGKTVHENGMVTCNKCKAHRIHKNG